MVGREVANRTVRQELRENLLAKMEKGEPAVSRRAWLRRHGDTADRQRDALAASFHTSGAARAGQIAHSARPGRISWIRRFPWSKAARFTTIPTARLCRACRERIAAEGDATPIAWLAPRHRYVEKLATPDVTIADMIGDVDPIKAARSGRNLSDELTIHYGLLPRANRGIFAINELPDLRGKIQVGLFNIMQEGDVQIKGYPVRMALDVLLVFTANPEDYTARGKIITPLKDRIGSEIRTHYPATVGEGMSITAQEAWTDRGGKRRVDSAGLHPRNRGRSGVPGARG